MKYEVYIVLAAMLWGVISIFKNLLNGLMLSEITVVFVRLFISAVLFGVYLLIKKPAFFKIRLKDLWCFLGTGIISLFLFSWCYFEAMTKTSVGVAVTLLYTSPVFVTFLSAVLFKEKITFKKMISLMLAVFGCVLVTELLGTDLKSISISGIVLGLLSGFFYALYTIFGKFAIKKGYNSYTITFYTFLFAVLASAFFTDFGELKAVFTIPDFYIGALGISVFCCVLPYLFYTKGLEHTPPGKASVLATIEPVVGTLTGVLIFSEAMSISKLIGITAILTCTILLKEKQND